VHAKNATTPPGGGSSLGGDSTVDRLEFPGSYWARSRGNVSVISIQIPRSHRMNSKAPNPRRGTTTKREATTAPACLN
jgi:hypothetical protein